ncbi:BI1-like protein [Artemisia annua]|uniref:BI1-like protein n=1 Tax=Artemisia annua TaxID=35608 RepID=A0A2U1QGE6_ARTAN|nr:BI1-like protein [Artemisia annua]
MIFGVLRPLHVYQQKHPLNFVFLGLFTASLSLTVGVTCANTDGKIVLEALILTSAVVTSLTPTLSGHQGRARTSAS